MSIAAAWLWANAQQIHDSSGASLWRLKRQYSALELTVNLGCTHNTQMGEILWCVTPTSLWLVSSVGQQYYVREFSKHVKAISYGRHPWFGRQIDQQHIDGFTLATYSSGHSADALVRAFRFRNSSRIEFFREIEHGRYHLVTLTPKADVFIIEQANTTYTFVIQAKRTELD